MVALVMHCLRRPQLASRRLRALQTWVTGLGVRTA